MVWISVAVVVGIALFLLYYYQKPYAFLIHGSDFQFRVPKTYRLAISDPLGTSFAMFDYNKDTSGPFAGESKIHSEKRIDPERVIVILRGDEPGFYPLLSDYTIPITTPEVVASSTGFDVFGLEQGGQTELLVPQDKVRKTVMLCERNPETQQRYKCTATVAHRGLSIEYQFSSNTLSEWQAIEAKTITLVDSFIVSERAL